MKFGDMTVRDVSAMCAKYQTCGGCPFESEDTFENCPLQEFPEGWQELFDKEVQE